MSVQKIGKYLIVASSILVVLSLVAGSILGQPILLSYVETGSMSPTLEPGDGIVAVPTEIAGPIEEGDVVVFQSQEVQGGRLTTHRVVRETDRGYITRGDANPFTDQANGEPPVKRAQIVAKALQLNGDVLVIPSLGVAVEGVQSVLSTVQRTLGGLFGTRLLLGPQGLAYLFFGISVVWYIVGEWPKSNQKRSQRETSRTEGADPRLYIAAFAILLVLGATAAMVGPTGTQEYGIVSAEFDSESPTVIPRGEFTTLSYPVANGGFVPTVSYLEPASDGVEVRPREVSTGPRAVTNATVTLHAPPETGYYRRFVVEHRYLDVLPRPVLQSLYGVHPWAPIIIIDALIGILFYSLGIVLVGTGRVRNRSRTSALSLATRLRRIVRKLY
jgi:signal peptidase